jgi:hypothetical protein
MADDWAWAADYTIDSAQLTATRDISELRVTNARLLEPNQVLLNLSANADAESPFSDMTAEPESVARHFTSVRKRDSRDASDAPT